jgi:hypothetical protein
VLIYQFYVDVQYTILIINNYNLIKIECVLCFFLHVCLCYPLTSNNILLESCQVTLYSSVTVQSYARQLRNIWRYQRGKHNPQIKDWQITQWPKEVGQEDKQYYTKYYTDNQWSSNTKPTKRGVILNGKTFMLHMWYSLYYSCYNENVDIKFNSHDEFLE